MMPASSGNYIYHGTQVQTSIPTFVKWSVMPSTNAAVWADGNGYYLSVSQNGAYSVTATTTNSWGSYSLSKKIEISGISNNCPTCPPILFSPLPPTNIPDTTDVDIRSATESAGISITLSPNPASTAVSIEITDNLDVQRTTPVYTVQIIDMSGTPVYTGKQQGRKFNISTSSFSNGIYTVIVSDGENTAQRKLVVKH